MPGVVEQALEQEFPILTEKKPNRQNVKLISAIFSRHVLFLRSVLDNWNKHILALHKILIFGKVVDYATAKL